MPWTSKESNKGSNDTPHSDPGSESRRHSFKHGHFYNGNMTTEAKNRLVKEGSKGLVRDQGFVRTSAIPSNEEGTIGQKRDRIKTKKQGSHAHLSY